MYRAKRGRTDSVLREGRIRALRARGNLVVLAEGNVGAAVGAAVGAVSGLFAGVIIFHILSSFILIRGVWTEGGAFIHRSRHKRQEITVPAMVATRAIATAPLYFFTLPPPYTAAT